LPKGRPGGSRRSLNNAQSIGPNSVAGINRDRDWRVAWLTPIREKEAMPSEDKTAILDADRLGELAALYREFAERAEPNIREH